MIQTLLKQPLLHFLLLGGLLFLLFDIAGNQATGDQYGHNIYVNRESLQTYLQYRTKSFDSVQANKLLNSLPDEKRDSLINNMVREEVLYREAKLLELGKDDYVIRKRMIQKLEFITQGFNEALVTVSEQQLQEYYQANHQDYYIEPHLTFTHVFFNAQKHGMKKTKQLAEQQLLELNQNKVSFAEGLSYGEHFLFFSNYVEKTEKFIASHLGENMATTLFSLSVDKQSWAGPYQSEYGYHLVMVAQHQKGHTPKLSEIKERVKDDARRIALNKSQDKAVQAIIDSYVITIDDELKSNTQVLAQ